LADCPIFEGDTFTARWIQECFVTALALEVNETRHSVTEAVESICQKTSRYSLEDITKFLFKEDVQLHQDAAGDASEILKEQKLQEEIKSLLASPAMLDVLKDLATQAFETSVASERYLEWCRTVIANTLAGAAEQTVCTVLPSVSEQSLNTDIEQKDDTIIIWLSERDVGGVGIITKFEEKYHQDSIGVLHIMAKSLGTTEYEQVDADLTELLRGCSVNPKIASVLEDYRVAANFSKRMTAVKNMKNTLIGCGIEYSHSFSSVLFSRLLRPNSTEKTDQKLLENLDHWKQLEVLLGIELPINIISVVLAIKAGSPEHRIFSDACKIQSVLWPRGGEVRASGLPNYSHFSGRRRTERLLASQLCPDTTITVEYGDAWQHNLDKALRDHGRADLFILRNDSSDISDVFTKINSTPLDTDGLLIYPRIIAIHRELDKLKIRIELAEMQY
jgi:ATP-dependent Lhr-like helicase